MKYPVDSNVISQKMLCEGEGVIMSSRSGRRLKLLVG